MGLILHDPSTSELQLKRYLKTSSRRWASLKKITSDCIMSPWELEKGYGSRYGYIEISFFCKHHHYTAIKHCEPQIWPKIKRHSSQTHFQFKIFFNLYLIPIKFGNLFGTACSKKHRPKHHLNRAPARLSWKLLVLYESLYFFHFQQSARSDIEIECGGAM